MGSVCALAIIAMAEVGCDRMPSVDERAAIGPCTLVLIVDANSSHRPTGFD